MVFFRSALLYLFIITSSLFLISGCGDDSPTGAESDEAPDFPEMMPVEIDNSLFEDQQLTGSEYEPFNRAGSFALSADMSVESAGSVGMGYMVFLQQSEPVYEDGLYAWTFSFSEEGEEFTIRMTAEETAGQVHWNLYMSGFSDELDESLDQFRLLSGVTYEDGSEGEWNYYSPEFPEDPHLQYDWEVQGDDQVSFTSNLAEPGEDYQMLVEYHRDGTDNWLNYSGFDLTGNVSIYWDSSNGTGYIEQEGDDRECWDETFAEVPCS